MGQPLMGGVSGAEESDGTAASNLHSLAVSLTALRRLLDRQSEDGALIRAEPALIDASIVTARQELRRMRERLAEMQDAADPWRSAADTLVAAVTELERLIDVTEDSLRRLRG